MPRTTAILLAFFAAFLLVYLAGFFNLDTKQGVDQFTKGMVKFVLHFLFLAASVTYLVQRGKAFYWRTVGWFMAGFAANGVYGVLQLLAAKAGHNLDHTVLSPLTGGASSINVYGSVGGTSVYRPNALTGDPNHLGSHARRAAALAAARLSAARTRAPVAQAARRRTRVHAARAAGDAVAQRRARARRRPARARGPLSALRVVARAARAAHGRRARSSRTSCIRAGTTSRSCCARACRRAARRARRTSPSTTSSRRSSTRIRCSASVSTTSRCTTSSSPARRTGGRTRSGSRSSSRPASSGCCSSSSSSATCTCGLHAARLLGRRLGTEGRPVRALAWGMTAALTGTIASNFFYLTMTFYYFYAFIALAVALPRRLCEAWLVGTCIVHVIWCDACTSRFATSPTMSIAR